MFKTIDDYGGSNVKSSNQNERVRFTFEIEEKQKALELFESVSYQSRDANPRMAIFYLKPEEIFEKYGDQEAEIFYAEQEK